MGYIVIVLIVILFSMTLHEVMHGFMAFWLGDDTAEKEGRLTLNPVKHVDPFLTVLLPLMLAALHMPVFGAARPVPFNPARLKYDEWGAALVALAGPLTNFVLAFLLFGGYVLAGNPGGIAGQFLVTGVMVNLGFFVFNMLPLPPLDGSRVVYALAPEFVRRAMEWMERYGLMIVFAIILIGGAVLGKIMTGAINSILQFFTMVFGVG